MASSAGTPRRSRRTKIVTTVGVLALVGAAGGYGTYAAFTDTTALAGSASAGTVRVNDAGADSRTFTVADLVPGDTASKCFVVAAPSTGNTASALAVSLAATNDTTASAQNTPLAGAMTVGLERAAAAGDDYSTNGPNQDSTAIARGASCDLPSTPVTALTARTVTSITGLNDTFTLAKGASQVYRVTVSLPPGTGTPDTAQGGTAAFTLKWTGSAGS